MLTTRVDSVLLERAVSSPIHYIQVSSGVFRAVFANLDAFGAPEVSIDKEDETKQKHSTMAGVRFTFDGRDRPRSSVQNGGPFVNTERRRWDHYTTHCPLLHIGVFIASIFIL